MEFVTFIKMYEQLHSIHFDFFEFAQVLFEFIKTDIGFIAIHENSRPIAKTNLTSYKRNDVLP